MTNPRDYPDVIQSAETGRPLRRGVKMLTIKVDGQSFTYGQPGWWASLGDPEDTEGQLTDEDNTIRAAARREARAKAKHSTLSPLVIRAIRESCGLSQKEAAGVFGGGRKAFEKYEAGEVAPSSAMTRLLLLAARRPELFPKVSSVPMISEADATLIRETVRKSSVDRIYELIYNPHPGKERGQLHTSSTKGQDRRSGSRP
jgi:HTH-type transcriptional regulator/antitoxin MqsA